MTVTINGTTGLATDSTSAVVEAVSLNHPSSSTAAITMDASNKVGIGTATPSNYYAKDLVISAPDEGGITVVSDTTHSAYLLFADGTSGADQYRGQIFYDHNVDRLGIAANGSTRLLIDSDGLKFNGDTAAANALDDYEETTWSPFWSDSNGNAIFNASPTVYQGKAIKIGSKVTAWGWHQMPSSFSTTASYAGTGGLFIGGLPYSSTTGSTEAYGGAVNYFNGWTGWAAGYTPMCYVGGNMNRIQLVYPITNTITSLPQSHVNSANSSIMVMVCYQTT